MKYIIDGRFLYGQVLGVQRYAREITQKLDGMVKDKPYDVEIAVPEIDSEGTSAEINSYKTKYDNIKIVIRKGRAGRKWEQVTFQRDVDRQKAKPVYLRPIRAFLRSLVTGMKYCSESLCMIKHLKRLMP